MHKTGLETTLCFHEADETPTGVLHEFEFEYESESETWQSRAEVQVSWFAARSFYCNSALLLFLSDVLESW